MADKIYDTKEFRDNVKKNKYKPLIDYNRRNIKDKLLLKSFSKKERQLYKKRIKVENTFCILKKFKRLDKIFDSYFSTYNSFLYLGCCLMLSKYF